MQTAKEKLSPIGELAIPFVVFLALYISTISNIPSAALDSISYITNIDTGLKLSYSHNPLFHPHHLLYNGLARIWIALCRSLGLTSGVAFLIPLLNTIFGALTLCVFYRLLRKRLGAGRSFALAGTALPAFSFGFWFYSICVEVYIIPLFFLVLSLYWLSADRISERGFALVGLSHGLAVLFHQVHVLFIPVVLLAAFLRRRQQNSSLWKPVTYYAATFSPLVAVPYLVVIFGVLKLRSPGSIFYWLTKYAHKPENWSPLAPSSLLKAAIGFGRSLIGFNFAFAVPEFKTLINKVCEGYYLMDEVFLVRNLGKNSAYILLGLSLILVLLLVFSTLSQLRQRRFLQDRQRRLIWLAGVWLAAYSAFFLFWVPENVEFWIPQSLCCWLIFLALCSNPQRAPGPAWRKPLLSLPVIAVLLFILNFAGGIKFLQDKNNDFYYQKSAPLTRLTQPDDLIIVGPSPASISGPATRAWGSQILYNYLLWSTEANVVNLLPEEYIKRRLPKRLVPRLQKAIAKTLAQGNKVFVYKEAVELKPKVFNKLWNSYQENWQRLDFGTDTIYIIQANEQETKITPGTL